MSTEQVISLNVRKFHTTSSSVVLKFLVFKFTALKSRFAKSMRTIRTERYIYLLCEYIVHVSDSSLTLPYPLADIRSGSVWLRPARGRPHPVRTGGHCLQDGRYTAGTWSCVVSPIRNVFSVLELSIFRHRSIVSVLSFRSFLHRTFIFLCISDCIHVHFFFHTTFGKPWKLINFWCY